MLQLDLRPYLVPFPIYYQLAVIYQNLKTLRDPEEVARWCNGKAFGLAISRSRVQILLEATLHNNLRQVVCTYVPLAGTKLYCLVTKGGDALRLGR